MSMGKIWNRPSIDECKKAVKEELDHILQSEGKAERLRFILENIYQDEDLSDSGALQRRFVLIISALVHHVRYEGLSKKQIPDLTQLAQTILRVSGVKMGRSALSYLYTELHSITSDIHFSQGEFLWSLWERLMAAQASVIPEEHALHQNLGLGICALRLGNTDLAIHFFRSVLAGASNPLMLDRTRTHLIKAYRLKGNFDQTMELIQQLKPHMLDAECLRELSWETACLNFRKSFDLTELSAMTSRGNSHFTSSYFLEMYLWAACHPQMHWLKELPSLASMIKRKRLDFSGYPFLQSMVQIIEQAYDKDVPLYVKMSEIKKSLPRIGLMPNVEHELLVWLALCRWLYRCRYYPMAGLFFSEYQNLSRKLSDGQTKDVLGLTADLNEINWQQ